MKYNSKLTEKYAKSVPGEQTVLLSVEEVSAEKGYSKYKAFEKHAQGMPVSAYRNEEGELIFVQRDGLCHALVAGNTGCGKSMRYLENCLYNLDGSVSVIVADVKGELYKLSSGYLKSVYGEDNVKYMDFIHPERSQILFNPFTEIAKKYLEAELYPDKKTYMRNEALADLKKLFDKFFPLKSKNDIVWDEGAKGFIYGIVLGLLEDMLLTREQENKTKRRRVLPEQINFEAMSEVFGKFTYDNSGFEDKGFFRSRDKSSATWQYVRGIMDNAPTTRACFMHMIEQYLSDYSYPDVRTLTLADNFDVASLGDKPQVIFLTYDISDARMRGLVNLYIVKALDVLKTKAVASGNPLNVPVQFFLDEFPTLQPDGIYPTIFSIGRGLNMFITAIVQDYTQLETSYSGGVAQQIRNNCNLTFFLGTNDVNTAKAVKEQIGRHVIPDPAAYLLGSIKFIETHVVSEDELMHRVRPGDAYITINNHMPVKGWFELYFDCPEYTVYPKAVLGETGIDNLKLACHYDAKWMDRRNPWEI
ncbi:MAG: type IV secretory system conjugative DNA transfer family protein [Clostridia bacterium]|nr:type IV secretory system conjugative DNA transfer family protein [Clostridia bacterium]